MGTHTPGPWSVGRDSNYPSSFGIIEGPSFPISYVLYATDVTFEMGEQRDRDARLIAAAPALLEALEGLVRAKDEVETYLKGGQMAAMVLDPAEIKARGNAAFEAARAAIAMAKGSAA